MRHEVITVPDSRLRRVWPLAIAAVFALQVALIATHDVWRDEYQALQIALQAPDLSALLAALHYEGHPPLWYLLLRATGSVLPARLVIPVVLAALAITAQTLILTRAPFPRWQRLCIALSPFLLFEHFTVARGASLGVCLLAVAFARPPRWLLWTAIALLPLVDFQFGVLSMVLIAIAWRDGRWSWAGAGAWLVTALVAAATVTRAPDLVNAAMLHAPWLEAGRVLLMSAALLVPVQTYDGSFEWNGTLPYPLWVIAGPGFLLFCWAQLKGRPLALALFGAVFGAVIAMAVLVYPIALRHFTIVPIVLILLLWREVEQGRPPHRAFAPWLAVLGACGLLQAAILLTRPFDRTGDVAHWIEINRLQHATWVSYPDPHAQGISALAGVDMLSLPAGCTQSFIHWDHPVEFASQRAFAAALRGAIWRHGPLMLSTDHDLDAVPGLRMQRLARFAQGYDAVRYDIYRVTGAQAPVVTPPPPCVPGNRPLALDGRVHG